MRIALVMTGRGAGGLQQSVVPYAAALVAAGHDVLAIIHPDSPFGGRLRAAGAGVSLVRWPRKPQPFTWLQAMEVRRLIGDFKADAVIGLASKGFPQAWLGMKGQMPVLSRCGSMKAKTVSRLLEADSLIVTSNEMRDLAVSLGMPDERVFVLPNFLIGPAREHRPPPRNRLRIGSLGRMVPRKGFDLLIDAAARVRATGRDFDLVIAGTGATMPALKEQATQQGLAVEFPGWIGEDEKPAFWDDLDIFVCPSRNEPFGFIYIEAMQAGLPVVTTETVGARFIFRPGRDCLMVPQEDAAALADALITLIDSPERCAALVSEARQAFMDRFHIDAAGKTLERIITTTIGRQAQR